MAEVVKISTEERYSIEGRISKLVPEGATLVNINYDSDGNVKSVSYSKRFDKAATPEELREQQKELDAMNSREQSQEEMNQVAGLLKKLVNTQ